MQSADWKRMVAAGAVALLSMSLLAIDAALDLSPSGFAKRIESTQASIMDAIGQHRLAFAVRAQASGKTPSPQCAEHEC